MCVSDQSGSSRSDISGGEAECQQKNPTNRGNNRKSRLQAKSRNALADKTNQDNIEGTQQRDSQLTHPRLLASKISLTFLPILPKLIKIFALSFRNTGVISHSQHNNGHGINLSPPAQLPPSNPLLHWRLALPSTATRNSLGSPIHKCAVAALLCSAVHVAYLIDQNTSCTCRQNVKAQHELSPDVDGRRPRSGTRADLGTDEVGQSPAGRG